MSHVYFGTRDFMRWVKAPAVNTPLTKVGWNNSGTSLNGGGYSLNGPTPHREYELTWGASPAKDIYDILDYRTGAYGKGYLYYVDPFAMRTNVLPEAFSMPFKLCEVGKMGGTWTPHTGTSMLLQPPAVAVSGAFSKAQHIPVPPGYSLWVYYVADSPILEVSGVPATPTLPTDTSPVWTLLGGHEELQWVGTGNLWGAQALILPDGDNPPTDMVWQPGKGSSGLKFLGEPQVTGLSAVYGDEGGLLNASATLIETELWDV